MNWKAPVVSALLLVSLPAVRGADPVSYREIAMLLRNHEDPQFIIRDTMRRKLLQPLSAEEDQSLVFMHAPPALMALLRDPNTLVSPSAAAAYAQRVQQQKQQALRDEQLAAQAAALALAQRQAQAAETPATPANPAGAAGPSAGAGNEGVGKQIKLQFKAADGSQVDLAKLQGKVVLIDFWATWCGPCMKEVPHVAAAYAKYHDKGFEIVGISLDQDKGTMLKVAAQKGMTWPQYFDGKGWGNEVAAAFHITAIPTMWLVNKDGLLVTTNARPNLEADIEKLLAQ